ncbi:MAG: DUF2628 domain-containing protein [Peptostreptococcaceae bacterium]
MSEENKVNPTEETTTEQINQEQTENTQNDFQSESDTIFCSKCGCKNSTASKFCMSCGNNLKGIEDNIKETTESIKTAINNSSTYKNFVGINPNSTNKASWDNKDMVDFIQKNPEYYIPKFEEMQTYQKSTSWNWASFFIFPLWLLYRKMYAYGFGLMVLSFILSYIPAINVISFIAVPVLGGLFGNSLYLKYIEKKLGELSNLNEDARHRVIISSGGVNLALPIVMVIVTSLLSIIFGIFGAMAMLLYY